MRLGHPSRGLFGGLVAASIIFLTPPITTGQPPSSASSSAEQAYYQLEGNVFDRTQIQEALAKLDAARAKRADDPWVYLTASLATLIAGYKIGDWYSLKTFEEGTADRALALALKAKDVGPKNSQCHAHFARILILKGDYQKAWDALNEAHRLSPQSFYPWYFRGIIAEHMRDATRARTYFDEAERRVSHSYQTSLINGHRQRVAKFNREYDEQERLLKENIKQNPDKPHLYGNYARFLMDQKRYDEAIQYWERAIAIGSYPEAVRQLEQARRLRQSAGLSDAPGF